MKKAANALIPLLALCLVAWGCYMIWPPLAPLVGGTLLWLDGYMP